MVQTNYNVEDKRFEDRPEQHEQAPATETYETSAGQEELATTLSEDTTTAPQDQDMIAEASAITTTPRKLTNKELYKLTSKERWIANGRPKGKKKIKKKRPPIPSKDELRARYPQGVPIATGERYQQRPADKPARYTLLASACVLGHNTRWNGASMPSERLNRWAKENDIDLIPVCPETECFGCPRPSFGLHYEDSTIKALVGSKKRGTRRDIKPELDQKCRDIHARHEKADGFIGIAGSPTCGISVGVKKLGNVVKGSMHATTDKPTMVVSQMWTKGSDDGSTGADVLLRRIDKYRSGYRRWSKAQRKLHAQRTDRKRQQIKIVYETDGDLKTPTETSLITTRLSDAITITH